MKSDLERRALFVYATISDAESGDLLYAHHDWDDLRTDFPAGVLRGSLRARLSDCVRHSRAMSALQTMGTSCSSLGHTLQA